MSCAATRPGCLTAVELQVVVVVEGPVQLLPVGGRNRTEERPRSVRRSGALRSRYEGRQLCRRLSPARLRRRSREEVLNPLHGQEDLGSLLNRGRRRVEVPRRARGGRAGVRTVDLGRRVRQRMVSLSRRTRLTPSNFGNSSWNGAAQLTANPPSEGTPRGLRSMATRPARVQQDHPLKHEAPGPDDAEPYEY